MYVEGVFEKNNMGQPTWTACSCIIVSVGDVNVLSRILSRSWKAPHHKITLLLVAQCSYVEDGFKSKSGGAQTAGLYQVLGVCVQSCSG